MNNIMNNMNNMFMNKEDNQRLMLSVLVGTIGVITVVNGIQLSTCKDQEYDAKCMSFLVWVGLFIVLIAYLIFQFTGLMTFGLWWIFM